MMSRKFFEADIADGKPDGLRGKAFGTNSVIRTRFGRDSSHKFGSALRGDERGVAVIEYALLCAFIALAVVVSLAGLGGGVGQNFNSVDNQVGDAIVIET